MSGLVRGHTTMQISTATTIWVFADTCLETFSRNAIPCKRFLYLSSSLASDALGMIGLWLPSLSLWSAGERCRCLGERSRLCLDFSRS